MSKRLLTITCACLLLGTGCNIIYKQNIQQGNALEQEDLDQLELGMNKNQVSFLLGTPAVQDPFHHDRWDYVYTFSRRGGEPIRRLVTLEFEDDALVRMSGVQEGAGAVTDEESIRTSFVDAADFADLVMLEGDGPAWSLQVGSFTSRSEADQRHSRLEGAGFDADIFGQVVGGTGYFVIRTGGYATRAEAEDAMRAIEEKTGLKAFLVAPGS